MACRNRTRRPGGVIPAYLGAFAPATMASFDQFVLGPGTRDEHVVTPERRVLISRAAGWISPVMVAGGRKVPPDGARRHRPRRAAPAPAGTDGLSASVVKMRNARALTRLRALLGDDCPQP